MAGDVGEEGNKVTVGQSHGIDEIAADFLTGLRDSVELEARRSDLQCGNEGSLNGMRQLQLILEGAVNAYLRCG